MRPAPPPAPPSHLTRVSSWVAAFRWIFMPLGLCALIAVGVHAAADVIDDRILSAVDRADAAFDAFFGQWSLTQGLVNAFGFQHRVVFARFLALAWELTVDVLLALPALGYRERDPLPGRLRDRPVPKSLRAVLRQRTLSFTAVRDQLKARPSTLVVFRPLATATVAFAGACAVARMVQGAAFLSTRGLMGDGYAGVGARAVALVTLIAVAGTLGWRAVWRNLEHAYGVIKEDGKSIPRSLQLGLTGTILILPLAWVALVDASPVLPFLR